VRTKPEPPREPAPEECCGKGCTPCVLDVYAEALERYRAELSKYVAEKSAKNDARRSRVRK
jgi:hypothetical protein